MMLKFTFLNLCLSLLSVVMASAIPTTAVNITLPIEGITLYETGTTTKRAKDGIHCCNAPDMAGHNWEYFDTHQSQYAIDAINAGQVGTGGFLIATKHCAQLIYWNAGDLSINVCNDNDHEINPDIGYLATYAQDIVGACEIDRRPTDHSLGRWTCGQQFDTDHYNVIIKKGQGI